MAARRQTRPQTAEPCGSVPHKCLLSFPRARLTLSNPEPRTPCSGVSRLTPETVQPGGSRDSIRSGLSSCHRHYGSTYLPCGLNHTRDTSLGNTIPINLVAGEQH